LIRYIVLNLIGKQKGEALSLLLIIRFFNGQVDSAFQAHFLQLASQLIAFVDIALGLIIGCGTTAAAIEAGPAIPAFFAGIDVDSRKLLRFASIKAVIHNISHFKAFLADNLSASFFMSLCISWNVD